MAALLRALGSAFRSRSPLPKVEANLFTSYTKHESGMWLPSSVKYKESTSARFKGIRLDKLKSFARNKWNGLDQRVQGAIIDGIGRLVFLAIPGGGGYFYLQTAWETLDKMEKGHSEMKQEYEKAMAAMKVQLACKDESLSRYREEAEVKYRKIESELRELRFLKDLWMSSAFQESSKADGEGETE